MKIFLSITLILALLYNRSMLMGLDIQSSNDMNSPSKNNHSFVIRPAQIGEEGVLYELICELAQHEGKDISALPLTKENLHHFGFGDKCYFYTEFAECEDKVIGYALYFYAFSANQGRPILYLEDLYVKPEYRGEGIGSELLKQLARYAIQEGCCRLEWHVFAWNGSAIRFYQKIGGILKDDLIQVRLEKEALQKLADGK